MSENVEELPERYDGSHGTCWITYQPTFLHLLIDKNGDSYFNLYLVQFILVALMYSMVGKGKYWKILFISALSGLIGIEIENLTIAFLCRKGNTTNHYKFVFTFLLNEIFWITTEYSIPLLNLIKLKVFSEGKNKFIKYIIYFIGVCFIITRLGIGFRRCSKGYLTDEITNKLHGYAYGITAVNDLICSISIIYYVRKCNKVASVKRSSVHQYIKRSYYIIILLIDLVCILSSILYFLMKNESFSNAVPSSIDSQIKYLRNFNCLILSIDAILFKFSVNESKSQLIITSSKNCNSKSNNIIFSKLDIDTEVNSSSTNI